MAYRVMGRNLVVLALLALAMVSTAWAGDSASGSIVANGTKTTLNHVRAVADEPFMGDEVVELVFSEKDASDSKDPVMAAQFDELGAAIAVKLRLKDMAVIGCVISHPALEHSGMSVIGELKPVGVKLESGTISGELKTEEPGEFFGDSYEIALQFKVVKP